MAYNKLQTMRDNIEAIRLALRLEVEGRSAQNAEERETLRKYAGFGGLKCILNDANELADAAKWSKSDAELFAPTVELHRLLHDYSHNDREFNAYLDSLKTSVLTAFYTDSKVVDAITDSFAFADVKVNSFLEPAAGQGAFVDSALKKYPGAECLAFEKDLITGKILSALHPSISTEINGFETIDKDWKGYFDLAMSNIPFGDFAVADPEYATSKEIAYRQGAKSIHNYFFLKALDNVREGGLVAFIAPQGVMNAASPFVRMELVKRSDLVAALRLPNNTFSENAGTDVGSDLIILQKHSGKKSLSADEEFFIQSIIDRSTNVATNKFFQAFPQNIICTDAKVGTDPYGKPAMIYTHADGVDGIASDIRDTLGESLRLRLNKDLYNQFLPVGNEVENTNSQENNVSVKDSVDINKSEQDYFYHFIGKETDPERIDKFIDWEFNGEDDIIVNEAESYDMTGWVSLSETFKSPLNDSDSRILSDVNDFVIVESPKGIYIYEKIDEQNLTDILTKSVYKDSDPRDFSEDVREFAERKGLLKPEINNTVSKDIQQETPEKKQSGSVLQLPLEKQYEEMKKKHPDAILLFRVGDFYETFKEDAKTASDILGITLTRRNSGRGDSIYLAGFPHHALDTYLPKLVRAGKRVAICEQLEDPKQKKSRTSKQKVVEKIIPGNTERKIESHPDPTHSDSIQNDTKKDIKEQQKKEEPNLFNLPELNRSGKDLSPRPYNDELKFYHHNGSMVCQEGMVGILSDVTKRGATFSPIDFKPEQTKRAALYVSISETYQQLYKFEAETHTESKHLREHLNQYYDDFVERYGSLNEKQNVKFILLDYNGRDALSLERGENGKFIKADIFDHPVSFSNDQDIQVNTPLEALAVSLNKYGTVDIDFIVEQIKDTINVPTIEKDGYAPGNIKDYIRGEVIDSLKGHIFYNPLDTSRPEEDRFEVSDKFIAGNVIDKAEKIQEWINQKTEAIKGFPGFDGIEPYISLAEDSLKSLKEAAPRKIKFDELDFNFGERWIPTGIYSAYMSNLYGTDVKINYSSSMDEFSCDARRKNMKIWEEFAVRGYYRFYDGINLLKHALHNTVPDIKKSIGKDEAGRDIKVADSEAIQLANSKIDEIRNGFTDWLQAQSPDFKEKLADLYNRKFNCFVRPQYDGSHQTFPNLNLKLLGDRYGINSIYQSQKDCIWMLKQNGGGICDHEVGTGKTLIMCVAAHEMKRLGLAHKPMIIGMKANVAEIALTYQSAYPNARILYANEKDFSKDNRVAFFNKMKNNDYDCIIMSHDQFGKIPQSPEVQKRIISDELKSVEENLEVVKQQGGEISRSMQKGLIKRKESLTAKLATIQYQMEQNKDAVVDFKQMGIDHLFVDESHQFKNLMFNTRHTHVSGLGSPDGSQRALNLLYAIRTIQERNGKDLGATSLVVGALLSLASCHCDHDEPAVFNKGHILCSDGTVMSLCKYRESDKEAVGIVFDVNDDTNADILGYAVYIKECPALAFADECGVAQNTSSSLTEQDGNTNTYSIYTTEDVASPMAQYVFDIWPYGQSAYIPSITELRILYASKDYVNERIKAVGGDPISDDDSDCWLWSSTEVEGQQENKAWLFSMNYGSIIETPKNQAHQIRPIIAIRK